MRSTSPAKTSWVDCVCGLKDAFPPAMHQSYSTAFSATNHKPWRHRPSPLPRSVSLRQSVWRPHVFDGGIGEVRVRRRSRAQTDFGASGDHVMPLRLRLTSVVTPSVTLNFLAGLPPRAK